MRIDEHILAGYLSGELSDEERAAVTEELIRDRQLREWLHLATEALAAADDATSEGPKLRLIDTASHARPNRPHGDRTSIPPMTHIRRAI